MHDIETSCCFTGHRATKLPWGFDESDCRCKALKKQIFDAVDAVYDAGIRHYICGMANGCDLYFGEAVLQLKVLHDDVTLEAAIPYEGQAERWKDAEKLRWDRIVNHANYRTVVSPVYTRNCMEKRNRYMVDNAKVLIAAYNGTAGGTQNTMLYAIRNKREVIQIYIDP